jgi:4'-phosphopantetheinyl transferase
MDPVTPTRDNIPSQDAPVELDAGRVDLWYAQTDDFGEPELASCQNVLSPEEAAQAERFRFERDRNLYIVAHALVRHALSHYTPVAAEAWRFQTLSRGKPVIDSQHQVALQFNLSHTRGMAVCGVTREGELGVDVEFLARTRSDLKLARRYFAPAETATLEGLDPEALHDRFLQFWTLKESYIKAVGDGLAMPLECFAFEINGQRPPSISFSGLAEDPARWQFAQLRLGGEHLAAVALKGDARLSLHAACAVPPLKDCRPRPLDQSPNHHWRL